MKVELGRIPEGAERHLPDAEPDASGIGINYAEAYLKVFKQTLEDGRKISCKRRGLKLTLKIGERTGTALMNRLEHGPDVRDMLRHALSEAAAAADATFSVEDGVVYLDIG